MILVRYVICGHWSPWIKIYKAWGLSLWHSRILGLLAPCLALPWWPLFLAFLPSLLLWNSFIYFMCTLPCITSLSAPNLSYPVTSVLFTFNAWPWCLFYPAGWSHPSFSGICLIILAAFKCASVFIYLLLFLFRAGLSTCASSKTSLVFPPGRLVISVLLSRLLSIKNASPNLN